MQAESWIALLRRIPVNYHDSLVLTLGMAGELILQTVVSLEPDYMVIRGRNAGSTESGRVFIVPFDQIEYVGFNRRIGEPELREMFGPATASFAEGAAVADDKAAEPAAAAPGPEAPAATPAPGSQAKKPTVLSKSILLARLRARLGQDGKPAGP